MRERSDKRRRRTRCLVGREVRKETREGYLREKEKGKEKEKEKEKKKENFEAFG